jgi:hypothetical protein
MSPGSVISEEITGLSLEKKFFCLSFREQLTGFHDLLRENLSYLFMLSGWSSMAIAFLMIQSPCLDFLTRMLVFTTI